MRSFPLVLFTIAITGCASHQRIEPSEPHSYAERVAAAQEKEREAAIHERQAHEARAGVDAKAVQCGNPVIGQIADQSTSGGERLSTWIPCWSVERDAAKFHQAEADRLHREARVDRAVARGLLAVEDEFCSGVPRDELTHTPFFHHEDIASAEPYVEAEKVRGARIHFKAVRGLDASWMRQALLCHRARAATIGYDPKYMAYDPTMLANVNVAVTERKGTVHVLVRSDDDETAAIVIARAKALLAPPEAGAVIPAQ